MGLPFALYFSLSILAGAATVSYACYTREQFYPVILFLVTSKLSFIVGVNVVVAFGIAYGKILKSLYFGRLRETEVEQLVERCKYSVMETCLALTTFRHELTPFILLLFGFLLFTKVFHWLCRGRIDYLEQVVPVPMLTHIRLQFLLLCLLCVDTFVAYRCVQATILAGNKSVLLLFGFEFVVLLIGSFNYTVRYLLLVSDSFRENGLQYKGLYIMILDILCDGLKFIIYVAFFSLVFVHYGLPIHIVREVWICFLTFQQRLASFIRYIRLTRRLDERLEDATPEEIEHAGNCLICREAMTSGKKLPCSHVFHIDCLRMWLQHQQSCPLCRTDIQDNRPDPPAVGPVPAAAAPANDAVPHEPQQRNAAAPVPAPVQVAAGPQPRVDGTAPAPSTAGSQSIPGFFIVTTNSVLLYGSPSLAGQLRTVYSKNHVLFCTVRVHSVDNETWLKSPVGWVLEKGSEDNEPNLLPVSMSKLLELNHGAESMLPAKSRKQFSMGEKGSTTEVVRLKKHLSQSRVAQGGTKGANRLERIVALQEQMEGMAATISKVQESLVLTQCLVSRLLDEEYDDINPLSPKKGSASPTSASSTTLCEQDATDLQQGKEDDGAEVSPQLSVRDLRRAYYKSSDVEEDSPQQKP